MNLVWVVLFKEFPDESHNPEEMDSGTPLPLAFDALDQERGSNEDTIRAEARNQGCRVIGPHWPPMAPNNQRPEESACWVKLV